MAKCQLCEQEMSTANGCTFNEVLIDGKWVQRSREHWSEAGQRCADCGAKFGTFHHMGCDEERCPKCQEQMLICECNITEARRPKEPVA